MEFLLQQNIDVVACGRNTKVGKQLTELGAKFHTVELAGLSIIQAKRLMAGCYAVWHCAALSSPWGKRTDFENINHLATKVLADAAGEMQISPM